ncbi:histidinol-phosphate aminotransferase [Myxococcus stipitatus DSM 14675]|uniref:Aminotransferase n=1 Tax=Myxococcus stipitatus (strain DSM 14675 / JCM 12634 / Mx s8) TaxID=1278073 RepID=L7U6C7_MYXSD|nr:histidinol-phosphate transaminase [Myxococcus stipitatus]AGC43147.1 histidinol-phosphate aminotransferase [Myxococcus stipitatus DSM 14675]
MSHFLPTRRALLAGAAATTAGLALRPELSLAASTSRRPPSEDPVRLFSNENRYGPCEGALRAMRESLHLASRYASMDSIETLKRLIAEQEGVTPEHVVLTAGAFEALALIANNFSAGGGGVVCSERVYDVLPTFAARAGGKVESVPLDASMAHDLDAMEARVGTNTRLVSVCNPSNPTGTIVDPAKLRAFCDKVSPRATVLVDEVYIHYLESPSSQSMVDLVRAGKNVLITRSFSKVYGLAGMRVGYALGQPALIKQLHAMRGSLLSSVSTVAAIASLQDTAFVTRMRKLNGEARKVTTAALDEVGLKYVPGHANFLWIALNAKQLDLPARFAPHGIHLRMNPREAISPEVSALRLTLGTVEEMRTFGTLLRSMLKS